ncbi:MAG TPA: hypothetical protein VFM36_11145, partial [Thermoanaerobaculia bacterium]|nr:hypothetical protein [Thermoanaerobaculia bacterium]
RAVSVRAQGWSGLRNGVLLRAAHDAAFDVVLTADQSFPFQQNLNRIGIAVVVISGVRNRIRDLRPLIPEVILAMKRLEPGQFVVISPTRGDLIRDSAMALQTAGDRPAGGPAGAAVYRSVRG